MKKFCGLTLELDKAKSVQISMKKLEKLLSSTDQKIQYLNRPAKREKSIKVEKKESKEIKDEYQVVLARSLNLRMEPSTDAKILTSLPQGIKLFSGEIDKKNIYVDRNKGITWMKIKTEDGREGWMAASTTSGRKYIGSPDSKQPETVKQEKTRIYDLPPV